MGHYDLMFDELKKCTHIFMSVSDTDNLCVQIATKKRVVINSEIPVNVDAEPRDLIIALESACITSLKNLGVEIQRGVCVFHENQKFFEHLYPGDESEIKRSERDVKFTEGFKNAVLDYLCEKD